MLKIRLSRTGKNAQASYRVVVQEHTAPVKGKFVDQIGFYLPTAEPKEFNVNEEKVKHWLSVGAQPSDTVAALLKKEGFDGMEKFLDPRNKKRKKKKEVDEPEEAPAPAAEAPAAEEPAAEEPAAAPAEEKAEEPAAAEPAPAPAEEAPANEEAEESKE